MRRILFAPSQHSTLAPSDKSRTCLLLLSCACRLWPGCHFYRACHFLLGRTFRFWLWVAPSILCYLAPSMFNWTLLRSLVASYLPFWLSRTFFVQLDAPSVLDWVVPSIYGLVESSIFGWVVLSTFGRLHVLLLVGSHFPLSGESCLPFLLGSRLPSMAESRLPLLSDSPA